jgi:hypothetical protein
MVELVEADRRRGAREGEQVGGEAPVVSGGEVVVFQHHRVRQDDHAPGTAWRREGERKVRRRSQQRHLVGRRAQRAQQRRPFHAGHSLEQRRGRQRRTEHELVLPANPEGEIKLRVAIRGVDEHATSSHPVHEPPRFRPGEGLGRTENEENPAPRGVEAPLEPIHRMPERLRIVIERRGAVGGIAAGFVEGRALLLGREDDCQQRDDHRRGSDRDPGSGPPHASTPRYCRADAAAASKAPGSSRRCP